MKRIIVTIFLSIFFLQAFSAHIKGGFFTYEYLGPGSSAGFNKYKITLTIYMICNPSVGQVTNPITFTIFNGNTSAMYSNPPVNLTRRYPLSKVVDDPCISNNQAKCYYEVVIYELNNYELPSSAAGYTISYQRCCRIAGMENISNSGSVGNTYSIIIPGSNSLVPNAEKNSSPFFPINDTAVVCSGSYFSYPFSATDKDGDVLTYALCAAYSGGSTADPSPDPADFPPYQQVSYNTTYSGAQPMGANVSINPTTGLISGVAPTISGFSTGEFVVTVCVTETRGGIYLGETRKELHIVVQDCVPVQAKLNPKAVTCDGFSVNFANASMLAPGTTYAWNFGDAASGANNTSDLAMPAHTYTDTGVYKVVLRVVLGGFCTSQDSISVGVYPGFLPDLTTVGALCKGKPVTFKDQTTTNFGTTTGWRWDFGNTAVTDDTSRLAGPQYTYPNAGTYNVTLIVGNTLGCIDTVVKPITIADNPLLTMLSKDTSYCGLDTLQLSAAGTGTFSWTPASNIINANTAMPLVYPTVPTVYKVTLNQAGCTSQDSVTVSPTNNLTTSITASSTSVCEQDTLTLTANSNYTSNLSWSWSPATSVSDPLLKTTKAFPATTATYTLTTRLGRNCVATATQIINVKPLLTPNAGPDRSICVGQTTAQLSVSGGIVGSTYQWTPATSLSNPTIANPVASPGITTIYKVTVSTPGCASAKSDSMQVLVKDLPLISLTNDTLICTIDTLQLQGFGSGSFAWSPNYNINNVNSNNPLVSPDVPTTYYAILTDASGCKNFDSVFVDVKAFVTINAGNDTTICRTDAFMLNTVSDALNYKWTPALYLNSNILKRPLATPLDPSITYTVVGNIGKCQSSDQVTIRTVPYPLVNITPDTIICFAQSAQLFASGGSKYAWTPASFLSNVNVANPVSIKPDATIRYTVSVTDVLGCPKAVTASVLVTVLPKLIADAGPNDTSIVIGQPLQLTGTGGTSYLWSPPTWLSSTTISNPVSTAEDNILYKLKVSNIAGCFASDSIFVKVFKVPPSFYVPSGFSPNNDGRNDVFKPILLGMRSLNYFRVFNRWGQQVFATSQQNLGWDGTINGNPQDPGTYVWMAEGETFAGQVIKKRGTVILLR